LLISQFEIEQREYMGYQQRRNSDEDGPNRQMPMLGKQK
jgi:hypothetical protein